MDDRGVSRVLGYSLTITISTILVAGLLIAGGNFVDDQRSDVVRSEMEVVGQRIAADIGAADRLVRLGSGHSSVQIDSHVPERIAGTRYDVRVRASDGNATLVLSSGALDQTIEVPVSNTTAVKPSRATGGDIVITYDRSNGHLEVTNE